MPPALHRPLQSSCPSHPLMPPPFPSHIHIPTPVYEPQKLIHTSYSRPKPQARKDWWETRVVFVRQFCTILLEMRRRGIGAPPLLPGGMQLVSTAAVATAATLWRGRLLVGVGVVELRRVPYLVLVAPDDLRGISDDKP